MDKKWNFFLNRMLRAFSINPVGNTWRTSSVLLSGSRGKWGKYFSVFGLIDILNKRMEKPLSFPFLSLLCRIGKMFNVLLDTTNIWNQFQLVFVCFILSKFSQPPLTGRKWSLLTQLALALAALLTYKLQPSEKKETSTRHLHLCATSPPNPKVAPSYHSL